MCSSYTTMKKWIWKISYVWNIDFLWSWSGEKFSRVLVGGRKKISSNTKDFFQLGTKRDKKLSELCPPTAFAAYNHPKNTLWLNFVGVKYTCVCFHRKFRHFSFHRQLSCFITFSFFSAKKGFFFILRWGWIKLHTNTRVTRLSKRTLRLSGETV